MEHAVPQPIEEALLGCDGLLGSEAHGISLGFQDRHMGVAPLRCVSLQFLHVIATQLLQGSHIGILRLHPVDEGGMALLVFPPLKTIPDIVADDSDVVLHFTGGVN